MSKYKVLTDGNGSGLIQVVGLGVYVPLSKLEKLTAERANALARSEFLVRTLDCLQDNSAGVAGLHLNGDIAPWSSLRQGGHFEAWLMAFDDEDAPTLAQHDSEVAARTLRDFILWGTLNMDPEFAEFKDCAEEYIAQLRAGKETK